MVEVREFIHPGTVFDPEAIQVLASALDDAWDRVQKSGSRFAGIIVHVVGGKKFHRVSGKLQFVHFAPLRGFDYSFGKNLSHCTRVSRPSKSATGFFNPIPCVIQSRCKHLNGLRIKKCLRVNKLSDFDHRLPHLSQVPGARRSMEGM